MCGNTRGVILLKNEDRNPLSGGFKMAKHYPSFPFLNARIKIEPIVTKWNDTKKFADGTNVRIRNFVEQYKAFKTIFYSFMWNLFKISGSIFRFH